MELGQTERMTENYITRDEFAATIDRLAELINEQTRSQSKDLREIREDLKASAAEGRASGKFQWAPLSLAFTIFSVFLAALWGVYSSGENGKETLLMEIIALRTSQVEAASIGRHLTQEHDVAELQRRVDSLEELYRTAIGTDSSQAETLRWLEWLLATDMELPESLTKETR